MLRAAAETRLRCVEHPHRRATRQCARCKSGYCDECAVRMLGKALCERCGEELEAKRLIEHPPVEERFRRFTLSLRNTLILVAILAVLGIPLYFAVRSLMQTPISPEEFARFRYAAAGTFETAEGVNVLSTVLGAQALSATATVPGHEEKRLIDEYVGEGYGGWRTPDTAFPHAALFETGQPTKVEKLTFQQQPLESAETYAREVEVLVSTVAADGPFTSLGRFSLTQTRELQRFELPAAVDARWIILRVWTNYGGPYASLGEFNAWILPRDAFGIKPGSTPPAKP